MSRFLWVVVALGVATVSKAAANFPMESPSAAVEITEVGQVKIDISLGDWQSGPYRASVSGTMAVYLSNLGGDMLDDSSGFEASPFEKFFSTADTEGSSFIREGNGGEAISFVVAAPKKIVLNPETIYAIDFKVKIRDLIEGEKKGPNRPPDKKIKSRTNHYDSVLSGRALLKLGHRSEFSAANSMAATESGNWIEIEYLRYEKIKDGKDPKPLVTTTRW